MDNRGCIYGDSLLFNVHKIVQEKGPLTTAQIRDEIQAGLSLDQREQSNLYQRILNTVTRLQNSGLVIIEKKVFQPLKTTYLLIHPTP